MAKGPVPLHVKDDFGGFDGPDRPEYVRTAISPGPGLAKLIGNLDQGSVLVRSVFAVQGQFSMKFQAFLLSASVLAAAPFAASAQVAPGWYLGVAGGGNLLRDGDVGNAGRAEYDKKGWAALGAVGYQFGDFRLEVEPGYRSNEVDSIRNAATASGSVSSMSGMLNIYHDFLPETAFNPYLGVGAGAARVKADGITRNGVTVADGTDTTFAYQGIAGATWAFTRDIAVDAAYRYFDAQDAKISGSDLAYKNHTVTLGLVFRFGDEAVMGTTGMLPAAAPQPRLEQAPRVAQATPPAPAPAPLPVAPVAPGPYIVFFMFDKADITPVAAQVLDRAIADFRATGSTSIKLEGFTDRAGSVRYNVDLSRRRADAVSAYLRAKGVAQAAINEEWFGEARPRVPTADGVRNDENRRVEIYLRK